MARPHTEAGVRRIGLPDRTLRAVVGTMPCPTCGAAIGHRCWVTVGKRKGHACGPHGERIQSWMDHGMPKPTTRRDAADKEV